MQLFDADAAAIEERLIAFQKALRKARADDVEVDCEYTFDGPGYEPTKGVLLSRKDTQTIRRRVQRLIHARLQGSGLAHLNPVELENLKRVSGGVLLIEAGDENWADQLAADLHAEFPWLSAATTEVWYALRRMATLGSRGITLPPLLLAGPPGIGKSAWARHLAKLCQLPSCNIEIGSGSSNFRVTGLERGWGSAVAGRPLQTIIQQKVGNPMIIVDEICKDHAVSSTRGSAASAADGMLALLEPSTASKWECPFYRVSFDMSHINWVLTANDLSKVPQPLLSRCVIVQCSHLTIAELINFTEREGVRRGLAAQSIEIIQEAIGIAASQSARLSLRTVSRMLDRAITIDCRPTLN